MHHTARIGSQQLLIILTAFVYYVTVRTCTVHTMAYTKHVTISKAHKEGVIIEKNKNIFSERVYNI